MSFLTFLEQEELNNRMKLQNQVTSKNWQKEREKAVKNVPFVIDIRGERGRQKDLDQQRMYNDPDENYSGRR